MLRNIFLITLSTFVLSIAGGRSAPVAESNGMNDTNGNGQNGQMTDTMEVEGTISSHDEENQMFVVDGDMGQDTIYYNDQTMFQDDQQDQILQMGQEVKVWYMEREGDNIATRVEMAPANGDGAVPPQNGDEENGGDTGKGEPNGDTAPYPEDGNGSGW